MCAAKWDITAANDNGKDECPISQEKYMGRKGTPGETFVPHRNGRI